LSISKSRKQKGVFSPNVATLTNNAEQTVSFYGFYPFDGHGQDGEVFASKNAAIVITNPRAARKRGSLVSR